MGEMMDKAEKLKAGVRAKVAHPFRVIKRHFGFVKVRYKGLPKSAYKLLPSPQKFLAKFNARRQQQAKVNFDRYLRRARNQLLKALHAMA